MATTLSQVLTFTAVAAGGQATLPFSLNINGTPVLPDLLFPDNASFSYVSSTSTTITVQNNSAAPADLHLWLWHQHTIDRVYGDKATQNLSPQPLWVGGPAVGGGGGGGATVSLINANGGAAAIGTPVYSSSAGHFNFAEANALATSQVIGLVSDVSIASGAAGLITVNGVMTLTTAQWDARVTGQVGGLTFNQRYWLDPAAPGKLTATAPVVAGQVVEPIGIAVSTTILVLNISPNPVLLT